MLLLIAGCDAIRQTPRTLAKKVSFDAYIVSPAKTPTSKVVDDPATKGSMYLINPPFISAADVATVQRSKDDGQNQSLMVKLTPAGAAKMASVTAKAPGFRIAFLINGTVVSAPTVTGPISSATFQMTSGDEHSEKMFQQLTAD